VANLPNLFNIVKIEDYDGRTKAEGEGALLGESCIQDLCDGKNL